MIQHVVERCNQSGAKNVVVATDDARIVDAVKAFSGIAVLTSSDHPSGTDRIAEASKILGLADDEIIVNVQGDEPHMPAELINQVAQALADDQRSSMVTASAPLDNKSQLNDPLRVEYKLKAFRLHGVRKICLLRPAH